jgi:hypothetical protein
MSRSTFRYVALLGPLAVAATLGLGSLPALAQTTTSAPCASIHFDLANPSAGARVEQGGLIVQGQAMDSRAAQGPGVDRVDFFLGSRDDGGQNVGSAVPGMTDNVPGSVGLYPSTTGPAGFETTVMLPNEIGGHDLFAYAHSTVTGEESVIGVPISIGEDPAKAFLSPTESEVQACMGASGLMTMQSGAPTSTTSMTSTTGTSTTQPGIPSTTPSAMFPPPPGASTTTAVTASPASVTLDVANPSPGDTVKVGGILLSGTAWDKASHAGPGVDRVDIFIDNPDEGGMSLGQAVPLESGNWETKVTIPTSANGHHSLYFVAHSTVSDQDAVVIVPVAFAP